MRMEIAFHELSKWSNNCRLICNKSVIPKEKLQGLEVCWHRPHCNCIYFLCVRGNPFTDTVQDFSFLTSRSHTNLQKALAQPFQDDLGPWAISLHALPVSFQIKSRYTKTCRRFMSPTTFSIILQKVASGPVKNSSGHINAVFSLSSLDIVIW